jgi:signal transduction histidine kinase
LPSRTRDFERSFPNESNASFCAFLCENDGQIIGDAGEQLLGSKRCISARLLVGLINSSSLMAFLEAVRNRSVIQAWEMTIHYRRSARSLLLHGSQTPFGILVFATLTPRLAALEGDRSHPSTTVTDLRMRSNEEGMEKPLSDAIHDLKNPISSIISACEYLALYSQGNLKPEELQMITAIESSARTLLQLSDRIAELSNRYGDSRMAASASSQRPTPE